MKSQLGLNADLPVIDIVKEAVGLLWQKRNDVVRLFLPAMILLATVDWAGEYFFPQDPHAEKTEFYPAQLLFVITSLILSILLATACHRFTLLPGSNGIRVHYMDLAAMNSAICYGLCRLLSSRGL